MASAISGSLSASEAEKKPSSAALARYGITDIASLLKGRLQSAGR